jgi:hypothetical protein
MLFDWFGFRKYADEFYRFQIQNSAIVCDDPESLIAHI